MTPRAQFWAWALFLVVLASVLRLYKIDTWPFAHDEIATLDETASLGGRISVPTDHQLYKLPRAIPVSHSLHCVGNDLFGWDERGSRYLIALFGVAHVFVVFVGMDVLAGRSTAIGCGLLVTMWPHQIFQCQQNRFYMFAMFFASMAMLLGAWLVKKRTTGLAMLVCAYLVVAILCHTLLAILFPVVVAAVVIGSRKDGGPMPRGVWLTFAGTACGLALFAAFYLLPLLRGWNTGSDWGYSTVHAVLASINLLGWPVALLAALGVVLMLHLGKGIEWYWLTGVAAWAAATVTLPNVVSYHPSYTFVLALCPLLAAGWTMGKVFDWISQRSRPAAGCWMTLAALLSLPELASHYVDGSRPDLRTAAKHIEKHWTAGDAVAGYSMAIVRHYAPSCDHVYPVSTSGTVSKLKQVAASHERLWIVVQSNRSGLEQPFRAWLGQNCSHPLQIRRRRFDSFEYCVDVYLYQGQPAALAALPASH